MTDEDTQDEGSLYGVEFENQLTDFNMTAADASDTYNTEDFGELPPDVQEDLRTAADDLLKAASAEGALAKEAARDSITNHGVLSYNTVVSRLSEIDNSGKVSALDVTDIRKRLYDHPEEDPEYHISVEFQGEEKTISLQLHELLSPKAFKLEVMAEWDAVPEMPDADSFEDHMRDLLENTTVETEYNDEHRPEHCAAQQVLNALDLLGVTRDPVEFKKGQKMLHDAERNELHACITGIQQHMGEEYDGVDLDAVTNVLRRWGYFGDDEIAITSRIDGALAWTFDQGRLIEKGAISKRDLRALDEGEA